MNWSQYIMESCKNWDEEEIDKIWSKGIPALKDNKPTNDYKFDEFGALIEYDERGYQYDDFGWEVDHIDQNPQNDEIDNLRPLYWRNNRARNANEPNYWKFNSKTSKNELDDKNN